MVAMVDMTSQEVNGVRSLQRAGSANGKVSWQCVCGCGAIFTATGTELRRGRAKACRVCSIKASIARATTHGDVGSREYNSYNAMRQRCGDPANKRYSRYGGRGIKVCARWLSSYSNFLEDMGRKPSPKHSLERLDVNGDYEPANCVWATVREQANNRSNNTRIEIDGRTQNISEWSRESGVNRTVILRRIQRGLSGQALVERVAHKHITLNGVSDSFAGWSRRTGIKASTIAQRINTYGWAVEKALTKGAEQ